MRTFALISALALSLATVAIPATADAAVVLWDGTGSTDTIDWAQLGGNFTVVNGPAGVTSTNGINASVNDGNSVMERRDQGVGWNGNFANGETLLWTQVEENAILTILFGSPVQAAGAQIQQNIFGAFTARITLNDGSFFDLAGNSTSNGDDSAIFLGAMSDTQNITSITFTLQGGQDFAIGDVALIGTAVPEPATWAMMLLGFGATGFTIRRARRRGKLATA